MKGEFGKFELAVSIIGIVALAVALTFGYNTVSKSEEIDYTKCRDAQLRYCEDKYVLFNNAASDADLIKYCTPSEVSYFNSNNNCRCKTILAVENDNSKSFDQCSLANEKYCAWLQEKSLANAPNPSNAAKDDKWAEVKGQCNVGYPNSASCVSECFSVSYP